MQAHSCRSIGTGVSEVLKAGVQAQDLQSAFQTELSPFPWNSSLSKGLSEYKQQAVNCSFRNLHLKYLQFYYKCR